MKPQATLALIFIILCVILLVQNAQVVTVQFLFWHISMSKVLLISLLLLVGFAGGMIFSKKSW